MHGHALQRYALAAAEIGEVRIGKPDGDLDLLVEPIDVHARDVIAEHLHGHRHAMVPQLRIPGRCRQRQQTRAGLRQRAVAGLQCRDDNRFDRLPGRLACHLLDIAVACARHRRRRA